MAGSGCKRGLAIFTLGEKENRENQEDEERAVVLWFYRIFDRFQAEIYRF